MSYQSILCQLGCLAFMSVELSAATYNLSIDFNDASRLSAPNQNWLSYSGGEVLAESWDENVVTRTVRSVSGRDVSLQFTYSLDPLLLQSGDVVEISLANFGSIDFGHSEFGTSGIQNLTLRGLSDVPTWDAVIESTAQISTNGGALVDEETFSGTVGGLRGPSPRNGVFLGPVNNALENDFSFSITGYDASVELTPNIDRAARLYPTYQAPGVGGFLLDQLAFDLRGSEVFIGNYGGQSIFYSAPTPEERITTFSYAVPLPASGTTLISAFAAMWILRRRRRT